MRPEPEGSHRVRPEGCFGDLTTVIPGVGELLCQHTCVSSVCMSVSACAHVCVFWVESSLLLLSLSSGHFWQPGRFLQCSKVMLFLSPKALKMTHLNTDE